MGYPVSVLQGHTSVISFIDFHPIVPEILISSSLDGTCRLWNALEGGAAVHVLTAGADFGPARALSCGIASSTRGLASSGGDSSEAGGGPHRDVQVDANGDAGFSDTGEPAATTPAPAANVSKLRNLRSPNLFDNFLGTSSCMKAKSNQFIALAGQALQTTQKPRAACHAHQPKIVLHSEKMDVQ